MNIYKTKLLIIIFVTTGILHNFELSASDSTSNCFFTFVGDPLGDYYAWHSLSKHPTLNIPTRIGVSYGELGEKLKKEWGIKEKLRAALKQQTVTSFERDHVYQCPRLDDYIDLKENASDTITTEDFGKMRGYDSYITTYVTTESIWRHAKERSSKTR
jgi:hypothetical protein